MERLATSLVVACLFAALFALVAQAAASAPALPSLDRAVLPADLQADATEVITGRYDAAFAPLPSSAPLDSAPGEARWYRLAADADWHAASAPLLAITDAGYTQVRLYAPPEYAEQLLWHTKAESQPRFSRRALVATLPADLRAGQPLYLRIDATRTIRHLRPALVDLASYQVEDLRHVRLSTLFASVQLSMVLAGACLWFALRDRMFAWFVGYAGLQLVYTMLMSGDLYDLPGGSLMTVLGQRSGWFFAAASAPLSISFILVFCDLHQVTPRPARWLAGFRWPFVIACVPILLPIAALDRYLPPVVNLLFLASSLLAIGTVALAVWRGNRPARFFLVAWMPQVVFTALRVSQLLLDLEQPTWLEYGFPFAMAFASVVVTLGLADSTLHARRERDFAHRLAHHDGLTGVLNRRALTARLAAAVTDAREGRTPLALLFLDLDHFKAINDQHGHLAGDLCLQSVAGAIARELHDGHALGRYGGEEFLAILPGASRADAAALGERIRRTVEALPVEVDGTALRLTISIGVADLLDGTDSPEQLIERADNALYRAKADGRNRVGIHALPATAGA